MYLGVLGIISFIGFFMSLKTQVMQCQGQSRLISASMVPSRRPYILDEAAFGVHTKWRDIGGEERVISSVERQKGLTASRFHI